MTPTRTSFFCLALAAVGSARAGNPTPAQLDHFEKKVRPVLVEHCGKCHGEPPAGKEAKGGLRTDGLAALLAGGDSGPAVVPGDPEKGKLIEAVRYKNADLLMPPKGKLSDEAVRDLERWVRDGAAWPKEAAAAVKKPEFNLEARKRDHWAWKPLAHPPVPAAQVHGDAVDAFLDADLATKKLQAAPPADKLVLFRRVTFALTGLPPTPAEIRDCEADASPAAYEKAVDRLLASPRFGERWARHWLDLVRYAETRGHEFEPEIPNAFEYRDYVIRAINADVPYNRFVTEHLAGDAVASPRLDPKTGANESLLGTGFWHLGEEVHSPVDVRQDQADRFDNRIDVATKAFLGLTVACARCHDHKFDAISAKDYTALSALLEGSTYRQARPDGWRANREVLADLEAARAAKLGRFRRDVPPLPADPKLAAWLAKADVVVDYAHLRPDQWLPDDVSFGSGPVPAGACRVVNGKPVCEPLAAAAFDPFWAKLTLVPGTAADFGPLGRVPRAGFTIRTPLGTLTKKKLHYLVRGGGMAYAAVAQHTVLAGPLHGQLVTAFSSEGRYRWVSQDLSGYPGQRFHAELTADPKTPFAVAMVVQADDDPPPVQTAEAQPDPAAGATDLAAVEASLAARAVWSSRQAPAMWAGPALPLAVSVRGNPRAPGAVVVPRSLEALAGPGELAGGRVELAAQWTDPRQTPVAARVAVNRVWHHLFGRGLVSTPDNFGALGEPPTHAELLDALATEFTSGGMNWSVKKLIRRLVLTRAYRRASEPVAASQAADPANAALHCFPVTRLEGEAIRDAMLSVSGRLDPKMYDPSVPIHLTPFLDGRGRPGESGPVDGAGRRSLYLAVRRNFLPPFLLAFDTPISFSTVGRRQVSNVPAQALILLNDPFVHGQAERWAKAVLAAPGSTDDRVRGMALAAFGRHATAAELAACGEFVAGKEADPTRWADLAHALFNVKDFVFIR